ncbi:hypothetical protein CM15mP5_0940 [bacterium]|nr:MAG: hypothetical protein CM15mP5_0940 [bacterium]
MLQKINGLWFPCSYTILIVANTMMVEPTESESLDELKKICEKGMEMIRREYIKIKIS